MDFAICAFWADNVAKASFAGRRRRTGHDPTLDDERPRYRLGNDAFGQRAAFAAVAGVPGLSPQLAWVSRVTCSTPILGGFGTRGAFEPGDLIRDLAHLVVPCISRIAPCRKPRNPLARQKHPVPRTVTRPTAVWSETRRPARTGSQGPVKAARSPILSNWTIRPPCPTTIPTTTGSTNSACR